MSPVKQIVAVRRLPGMTRKEFFDYHYQVHGKLGQRPTREETPRAYFQTHFFDTAYASSSSQPYSWAGHDDVIELYFDDTAHLGSVYGSEWVKTKVGPDASNFSDSSALIPMFVREETLYTTERREGSNQNIVATFFVQSKQTLDDDDAWEFAKKLNDHVIKAFKECAQKIVVNSRIKDELDMLKYFHGGGPNIDVVYQVYLKNADHVRVFRSAQRELEAATEDLLVKDTVFACFGVRSVVLDQSAGIEFNVDNQPRLPGTFVAGKLNWL